MRRPKGTSSSIRWCGERQPEFLRSSFCFAIKGGSARTIKAPALTKRDPITKQFFFINALGPVKGLGNNHMEIRGVVKGHRPDAEYRFGRTINSKTWYLAGKDWKLLEPVNPPGTNDKVHRSDEDDFPDNDHIYSIDTPGFTGPETAPEQVANVPPADRATLSELVQMLNATETVEARVAGGQWKQAGQLDWKSVCWLEKVDGVWRRKSDSNKIEEGDHRPFGGRPHPRRHAFLTEFGTAICSGSDRPSFCATFCFTNFRISAILRCFSISGGVALAEGELDG